MRATIKIPIQKTSTRFHRSILSVVWIHFVNSFIYLLHLLFKLIINCSKTTFFLFVFFMFAEYIGRLRHLGGHEFLNLNVKLLVL